ncbi:MAG TPA: sigma-54 dependent transcriptional regulator [Thermodesulfobacteriota bacterium]|nr:sigma-54 dependent transcriptional regulator [Thermodesulfobacteriota bacterium]
MASILLADDNESMRVTLSILLKNSGHEVATAASGEEAIEKLGQEPFDLVVTDLKMKNIDGLEVVKAARTCVPPVEAVVITAYGSIELAVQAMKLGAFDFLTKSFETEEFLLTVSRALERRYLISEVRNLRKTVKNRYCLNNVICRNAEMKKILDVVERISTTDTSVLIEGESGVGKELVAKAIHNMSHRSNGHFVAINCGALPENLLESELFGHVKGAFTGAIANKAGLFEEASGGTLLLDEIGDMSTQTQVRLLRVLQEMEIRRIGSNKTTTIDVRVISASNRDLRQLISEGRFREDLYYRLNTVTVTIPPLRERREDIPPLIEHFICSHSERLGKTFPSVSREVMGLLLSYNWPGNVRELQHVIENILILSSGETIQVSDLPASLWGNTGRSGLIDKPSLKEMERSFILACLKENSWNQTKAARMMGIGRNTLWRKLREYNIIAE